MVSTKFLFFPTVEPSSFLVACPSREDCKSKVLTVVRTLEAESLDMVGGWFFCGGDRRCEEGKGSKPGARLVEVVVFC